MCGEGGGIYSNFYVLIFHEAREEPWDASPSASVHFVLGLPSTVSDVLRPDHSSSFRSMQATPRMAWLPATAEVRSARERRAPAVPARAETEASVKRMERHTSAHAQRASPEPTVTQNWTSTAQRTPVSKSQRAARMTM
ncbi:hypothetical protein MHYP_G00242390 [Metynnis hypsauchen]